MILEGSQLPGHGSSLGKAPEVLGYIKVQVHPGSRPHAGDALVARIRMANEDTL